MIRALLFTSTELRHRYAAGVLASRFDVCGIVAEKKKAAPERSSAPGAAEDKIVREHFLGRDAAEKRLLGDRWEFSARNNPLLVDNGGSSTLEVFNWAKTLKPEVVVLYGSSIIKPPLLSYFEGCIINLHLGLSPYYRGSATNFWPLVDGLPECVGATIHLATLKVDGGDMLAQARPENMAVEDGVHELGTKAMMQGVAKLCEVVPAYLKSRIKPVRQAENIGRLCRRKDFTHDAVVRMKRNFDRGMIREYLARKFERNAEYPIVR